MGTSDSNRLIVDFVSGNQEIRYFEPALLVGVHFVSGKGLLVFYCKQHHL